MLVNGSLARRAHEAGDVADPDLDEGGGRAFGGESPRMDSSLSS